MAAAGAALPTGCVGRSGLDTGFPDDTSDETRQLSEGIISRGFTHVQQVTELIRQQGASPNAQPQLRV